MNTPDQRAAFRIPALRADYVMLAGDHWNSADRKARLELLEEILQEAASQGLKPAIGLQTLSAELQVPLDRFNKGEASAAEFRQVAVTQEKQGLPPELEEVLTLAEKYKVPLYGLNVPRRVADAVSQRGPGGFDLDAFTPEDRAFLPQTLLPQANAAQKNRLAEIYNAHQPYAPRLHADKEKGLENFLFMQNFWDSAIAANCRKIKKDRQITGPLLIWGGPLRLGHGYGVSRGLVKGLSADVQVFHPLYLTGREYTAPVPNNGMPGEARAANYYYASKAEAVAARMPFTVERRAVLSIPAPEDAMLTVEERSGVHPVWPDVNTTLVITALASEQLTNDAHSNAKGNAKGNAVNNGTGNNANSGAAGRAGATPRFPRARGSHDAADVAGLKPGDVLISVDNEETRAVEDLENIFISRLSTPRALDRPVFVVWRKGEGLLRIQDGQVSKAGQ